MKKFMAALGGIALLSLGAAFFIVRKEGNHSKNICYENNEKNSVSAVCPEKEELPEKKVSEYLIKEYKGNIAVFETDKKLPFRTTSISVNELPEVDRNLLKKGICVYSSEEMNAVLEDYCS